MKKILCTIFLLIFMMSTTVLATTNVSMEIVEDNICNIDLNENCFFEKKIIDSDLENHKVTLQLKISNESNIIIPSGELILVIDSSQSMNEVVEGTTTRKNLVLESANKLVESLLTANPTSLKIGVVTFSTSSQKNDEGYLITGTTADAQTVCDFTNDLSILTSKISSIEGTGQYTNLDSGLQLAKKQFSTDNNNKYMIVLTDGLPNIAVGYNDLVSFEGLTDVIKQTKSTLNSLTNVKVITMLTGINNEAATFRTNGSNTYTYGQVINEVFGTEENPTKGKFYKINDTEIEQTITDTIYRDLLPIESSLDNITIIDYIPQYISDNFDITLTEDSIEFSAKISEDKRTVTWNINKLLPGESQILKFDLILKDNFDESIINKILDTNEKVDITYNDFDGEDKIKTSSITPKIKLTSEPEIVPESEPEPEQNLELTPETKPELSIDTTVAENPLPKTGTKIFISFFIISLSFTIFFGYKSFKNNLK